MRHRTQELFERYGIKEKLKARGIPLQKICIGGRKRVIKTVDFNTIPESKTALVSRPLFVSQHITENTLNEKVERLGGKVERGIKIVSLEQSETNVSCTLSTGEIVIAKYVVGADGAHSVVRHASNVTFEGAPYESKFVQTEVDVPKEEFVPVIQLNMDDNFFLVFPQSGCKYRLVYAIQKEDVTLQDFEQAIEQYSQSDIKLINPSPITEYRLSHRQASNYRDGRLFLAGDAAHIHSPAGGQGMNTGIQDSLNLGWKLALVVKGLLSESLLDTYNEERHPVGAYLLKFSDSLFNLATSRALLSRFYRVYVIPFVLPVISRFSSDANFIRFGTQLGIRYHSKILGQAGGRRCPDCRLDNGKTTLYTEMKPEFHYLIVLSSSSQHDKIEKFINSNQEWLRCIAINVSVKDAKEFQDEGNLLQDEFNAMLGSGRKATHVLVRPDAMAHAIYGAEDKFDHVNIMSVYSGLL